MSQNVVPSSDRPKTKNTDSENVSKNKSARQRLRNELMTVMKTQNDKKVTVSAFPEEGNIFKWIATIVGPADTVFEGLTYKLSMEFTTNYPFSAPVVKFMTHCFHPNVDQSGNICLDILKEKWSASYDVIAILLSIQSLLGEPNNASPLNAEAAALWSNQQLYKKQLTEQYALKNKETKK